MTDNTAIAVPAWTWALIVLGAALAQTVRNAAQRKLVAQAGTLGATLARFLYGLPFALAWVAVLHALPGGAALPPFNLPYFAWVALGAAGQLAATALLLSAMRERNFVVGVAYSKTDALQVALFGTLFLGELPGWITVAAIVLATAGVVCLSLPSASLGTRENWTSRAAALGLASGAGFAISAVGYRGAALALPDVTPWLSGAWSVVWAQGMQSVALGGWLAWRAPQALHATARAWRVSFGAGCAGAIASIGWFTAFALASAAHVRALGMVEVVFSYLVSRRLFDERVTRGEQAGLALVMLGLVALVLPR